MRETIVPDAITAVALSSRLLEPDAASVTASARGVDRRQPCHGRADPARAAAGRLAHPPIVGPVSWPTVSSLSPSQRQSLERVVLDAPAIGSLASAFAAAGHELHLVGGSVRDALIGRLGNDLDFTTDARPDAIERLLRTVTRATWDMGREFGTIGGRVREADGREWIVEITTYRADAYDPASRKPLVAFGDVLVDDLKRRDFRVNAMALSVVTGAFTDPFDGLADLENRVIRTPASAELSFGDDPLRMMRAARFVSQLGFVADPAVVTAMREMARRLSIISAERVRDELSKLMLSASPWPGLDLLVDTGLAELVLPEVAALRAEVDEHKRHKNIYLHTLTVLDNVITLERERGHGPDLIVRMAALLHDIGKPRTKRFEAGGVTFHHHDVVGAKMAKKRLTELRFSSDEIKSICLLIELHLRFHGYAEADWSDSAVRRYVRDAGPELERLHILTRADCTTRNVRKAHRLRTAYEQLEFRIDALAEAEELDAMRPDLDGVAIMGLLGIGPGPVVGEAYRFLLERRLDEGPLGEERAREELLAWWASRPS
ncbi:CCA tRNA nucleotidyltransferase [Propioniciclava tarda]|uniref:CCA tRNA nucleotidyltransferase n=1 Tax=Propioniciclava tarda TaxID=433330 RepID=A0A4Q9KM55_PROTD|nr:CCA tRNA nucleotidyltransferase [Propioniciclava tarda]